MPTTRKQTGNTVTQSSAKVACTGVLSSELSLYWAEAAPLLKPALGDGETIEQVLSDLLDKKAQLWVGVTETRMEGACVTEIFKRGAKYCNIWLMGGRGINNWLYYLSTIEAWAKAEGCDAMLIERGRLGWQRVIPEYKIKSITLTKEL